MYTFKDLVEITAKLRSPEGCPWDREQTFESLKQYLANESQEVFQAVDNKDLGFKNKTFTSVFVHWVYLIIYICFAMICQGFLAFSCIFI